VRESDQPMLQTENPDRVIVAEAAARGLRNVPVRGTGIAEELAMVLESAERGRVVARFTLGDRYAQGNGVVQGGTQVMLLDAAMAFACLTCVEPGETVASVSLTANYMKPARPGMLRVAATVEQAGRRMCFSKATLLDETGRTLATASAPFAVLSLARA